MRRLIPILLLLTGCPRSVPYVPPPELGAVSMAAHDWSILYSFNMPPHPSPLGNGWQIQLPGPAANLQYVQVPFTAIATPTPGGTCTANGYISAVINGTTVHLATCQ